MKEFIYKYKFILVVILIAVVAISIYGIRDYRASRTSYRSKADDEYQMIPKKVGVNEYTRVNVSTDTLVRMYFSNFRGYVKSDGDISYYKLDEEYRNKRFPNIEDYRNYIKTLDIANAKIAKYSVETINEKTVYIVYDTNNNYYAFKIDGVLEYTVYLDDDTVEIR